MGKHRGDDPVDLQTRARHGSSRDPRPPSGARALGSALRVIGCVREAVVSIGSSRLTPVARASVAPFLLLLAPFLGYLRYQHHGVGNAEALLFVLLIAGIALLLGVGSAQSPVFSVVTLAGLLTFLADIQAREPGLTKLGLLFLCLCAVLWVLRRGAHRIISLMMATVILTLWLLPQGSAMTSEEVSITRPTASQGTDRPLVLHLLMDEFIGVEGIPTDLAPPTFKRELQSFFRRRGFRLFGKAYSEFPMTVWSVPHLLNLEPGRYVSGLTVSGPSSGTHRLTQNAYFHRLLRMGYSIQVHEPDYLYLCPEGLPASCHTYPTRSLDLLNRLGVPLSFRFAVVAGTFLNQSEAYTRLKQKYQTLRLHVAPIVTLPLWNWERGTEGSAGALPMLDAVMANISETQRSTAVFVHILLPHYPYIFDAECNQRPPNEWMSRSDPDRGDIPNGIVNLPEGRAARYRAYLQQVACTLHQIDRLIAAIPPALRDDAIIIVQGDHGSRIGLVDPTTVAKVSPVASDYVDAFSTMFAVRSSPIDAVYDLRTTPITCLLRSLVDSNFLSIAGIDACSSPNIVFFMTGGKKPPDPRALPDFGQTSAEQAPGGAASSQSERPARPGPTSFLR